MKGVYLFSTDSVGVVQTSFAVVKTIMPEIFGTTLPNIVDGAFASPMS